MVSIPSFPSPPATGAESGDTPTSGVVIPPEPYIPPPPQFFRPGSIINGPGPIGPNCVYIPPPPKISPPSVPLCSGFLRPQGRPSTENPGGPWYSQLYPTQQPGPIIPPPSPTLQTGGGRVGAGWGHHDVLHGGIPNYPQPLPRPALARPVYRILVGKMFDSYERTLVPNQSITVDKEFGVILDVRSSTGPPYSQPGTIPGSEKVEIIDLKRLTVVPGFVDAHVHLFLHPYSETSWVDQLTKESLAERVARATVHARRTLLAGFTTVRDLGTEGAFDADLGLRKAMAGKDPIVHGPRYYCASRAIVSTGSYGPKSSVNPSSEGIEGVTGAEVADGVDECVRAVRRQVGAGADWIKIYGDYRIRSRMSDVSPLSSASDLLVFTDKEVKAMVETAHALGVKVAVHAQGWEAIEQAMRCYADTIEHGTQMGYSHAHLYSRAPYCEPESLRREQIWVPTLAVFHTTLSDASSQRWTEVKQSFEKALDSGDDRIACGGDTGTFAHGKNALELVLMRQLGAKWNQVLAWATLGGWKCVRDVKWDNIRVEGEHEENPLRVFDKLGYLAQEREVPFGAIRKGWAADLVGIEGDIEGDPAAFEKAVTEGVKFVMKGGRLYKTDGKPVVEAFV
ncbi:hypothetical protein BDQ17DRAFT_1256626 [Cyathus striatus]|nr:hypothetical protein BDQ17DRAFT_1256626 [Cyathus striatus]